MELDDVDRQILKALKVDARMPFTEIGRDLGISDATVHVRVKKLVDEGIIKRFTTEVDEKFFGKKVQGFVLINVAPGSLEDTVKQLIKNEKVEEVHEIHGPNDLLVKVWAESLSGIRDLMLRIRETPNVRTSELVTVLKVWRQRDLKKAAKVIT